MPTASKPASVDAYIAAAPPEKRAKLKELRSIIRKAAPKAEERLSYGMPYYHFKGRVAYFQHAKSHLGVYVPTPILEQYRNEVRKYQTGKATLRFPLDKRLPRALISRLIKARVRMNQGTRTK